MVDNLTAGQFCWVELLTDNIQAAIEFYPSVWDWRAERADEASDFYTWHCAGATFGALYQIP
ncbi:MAG: hypothetical protein HWE11_08005, partial [Gammaproteobacteria bacterium]|nr:hypothetical protein [Gammaproteobacteria bacterium]